MDGLSFLDVEPSLLKTEERIIVAAIKIFAEYPLHVVTVRMIAKEARVCFSSITYHFRTKENLYQEVIRRFLNHGVQTLLCHGESASQPLTPEAACHELRTMVIRMTDWIYGSSHATTVAKIIFREHVSPSPLSETLYDEFFGKVITQLTTIVSSLINVPENVDKEREAALLAFSIFGQIGTFRLDREMLVRHLGFTGFSASEIAELQNLLLRNIFRQLGVPALSKP